jgi:KDO2-lipid IV(A) lauroyltransferase
VVFHRDRRPLFETMRSRLHERLGLIEAPVEKGLEMWMSLRDALARDEVVMLQADRVMPGQSGHKVEFLGGHMLLPPGPIKLAAATGAPLIPVFTLRTGPGRVRVMVEEPIFCDQVRIGDDAPPALLAVARVLEKYVRAYPQQWLMLQPACCEDANQSGLEFSS